jgi:hypothetical protein
MSMHAGPGGCSAIAVKVLGAVAYARIVVAVIAWNLLLRIILLMSSMKPT